MANKKHKRFDSLANDQILSNSKKDLGVIEFGMTVEKLLGE